MDIGDLWVKQEIDDEKITLVPTRTEHMLEDVLTKPMDAPRLRYFYPFFIKSVDPKPPKVAYMPRAGKLDQGAKKKFQEWQRNYMEQQRFPQRVALTVGVFL